ncbi:MAG: MGMT family protein [Dehalococcoidales bacterium]|nr:MGMT family protein [Dehalococcoidales bacterium]
MAKRRKSWQEKLHDDSGGPRVVQITEKMNQRWGTGTVVIPAPLEVDAYMRSVPPGKVTTINEIRQALALKHGATIGCPITTGIFAWVAANAADELAFGGEKNITPYWRTLKTGGELNPRYPGGVEAQAVRLEEEGHTIVRSRGKARVQDYEKKLAELKDD